MQYNHCVECAHLHGNASFLTAIRLNHVTCLKMLLEQGYDRPIELTELAAETGNIEIIKLLIDSGCVWSPHTFSSALRSGNLEMIKFLESSTCPVPADVTASYNGHLHVLQYLYDSGRYEFSANVAVVAAMRGWTDCFIYAMKTGMYIGDITVVAAFEHGHTDILELLLKAGHKLPQQSNWKSNRTRQLRSIEYLKEHELPIPIMKEPNWGYRDVYVPSTTIEQESRHKHLPVYNAGQDYEYLTAHEAQQQYRREKLLAEQKEQEVARLKELENERTKVEEERRKIAEEKERQAQWIKDVEAGITKSLLDEMTEPVKNNEIIALDETTVPYDYDDLDNLELYYSDDD